MTMHSLCKFVAALAFFPISLHSASFNCSKASTLVEHFICSDTELSAADNELSKLYKISIKSNNSLFEQQKLWLKTRNNCKDVDCVRSAYRTRLSELNGDNSRPLGRSKIEQTEQLLPLTSKTAKSNTIERQMPETKLSETQVTTWMANVSDYPVGKPCKVFLDSLSLPYRPSNSGWAFELTQGNKVHPDISEVGFDCTEGNITTIQLLTKWDYKKDAVKRARLLTDKIVISLNLLKNGWKLIDNDIDGTHTSWRTSYAQYYQRDRMSITFEAYGSRDGKAWIVQVTIS